MRVVAAPAPFKAALGPADAAAAIAMGARLAGAEVMEVPVADGGEGTLDALVTAGGGRIVEAPARDPLARPITAAFGMLPDGTAVVELAQASGYERLADHERDPEATTTAGTGDLMRAALDTGCTRIIVGVGGSATTDGGLGLAIALGAVALDDNDEPLAGIGGALLRVRRVDLSGLDPRLTAVPIDVACDVTSPLTGPEGSAAVFGPQKGATPDAVERLDEGLANLAAVLAGQGLPDVAHVPRAGAAGGAAGGMMAMLGAALTDGGALVTRAAGLPAALVGADLCITGEGRLDEQTLTGKAPAAVAAACAEAGVPCVGLFGQVDVPPGIARRMGLAAALPIGRAVLPLPEALAATADDLAAAAASVVALRA
ncbi:MAG: glycerate kinase [Acidobacteria bacterium]|nr:glycerate kinase [Acidobacteriota bacterium]